MSVVDDSDKTKDQLIAEVRVLRAQLASLQAERAGPAEEALREANRQLSAATAQSRELAIRAEHAREAAEAVVRQRAELIASLSHDLKNPLTTIKGLAQMTQRYLAQVELPEGERINLGLITIANSATRVTALLDDILTDTRRQIAVGETLPLKRQPTDLIGLVRQVTAQQQQTTDRHKIEVEIDAPELIALWDGGQLERMLANLVGNALKYSPAGGPVTVTLAREDLPTGEWAIVRIRDRGLGIPAADLPHIFERFRRGTNVPARIAGTGIGLSSVRQIVEQHGGTIVVESEEGTGTTVTVRLPLSGPPATI